MNYKNVKLINTKNVNEEEKQVLDLYMKLQQAMIDKDLNVLNNIITDDSVFVHMTGKRQTKDEFIGEIMSNILNYFEAEIKDVEIKINGDKAHMTGKLKLDARVYGMSGIWTLNIDDDFIKVNNNWYYAKLNAMSR